jgi:hypothetical protein
MSEHIILATLPGQEVSTSSESALEQTLPDNLIISPTGPIAQVSRNGLPPAGRRPGGGSPRGTATIPP